MTFTSNQCIIYHALNQFVNMHTTLFKSLPYYWKLVFKYNKALFITILN
jgi:hypothetical protein